MTYSATVVADSVSPAGIRLTSLEVNMPRIILAEFNTHRVFSRNSASSRAIPIKKRIEAVKTEPFIPDEWGTNKPGMQAGDALDPQHAEYARQFWISAMQDAITGAMALDRLGVHKQLANRLLEPFSWHRVIVTATDWDNFFHLREHSHAQPEMQRVARAMHEAMNASTPRRLEYGDWHLPYVTKHEIDMLGGVENLPMISAARCARVSYLTHDGRSSFIEDLNLGRKLLASGHMSPFEHPAHATKYCVTGNFRGWQQYRKMLPNESDPLNPTRAERN